MSPHSPAFNRTEHFWMHCAILTFLILYLALAIAECNSGYLSRRAHSNRQGRLTTELPGPGRVILPSKETSLALALLTDLGCKVQWSSIDRYGLYDTIIVMPTTKSLESSIRVANTIKAKYHFVMNKLTFPRSLKFPKYMVLCDMDSVAIPDNANFQFENLLALEIGASIIGKNVTFDFLKCPSLHTICIWGIEGERNYSLYCHPRAQLGDLTLQTRGRAALNGIPTPYHLRRFCLADYPGDPAEIKRLLSNAPSNLFVVWFENCNVDEEVIRIVCELRNPGLHVVFRNLDTPGSAYEGCRNASGYFVFENTHAAESLIKQLRERQRIEW